MLFFGGDYIKQFKTIDYHGTKVTVSTTGDVIWKNKTRIIYYNADGYSVCSLKLDEGWRSVRVARLVAIAFIPNPKNLPEVNHKDYDRSNSNVENLEWVTRKENVNYSNCNRPNVSGINNPNYGNRKLSEIYKENKDYSKEKQGRPGLKNGRCRKIKLFKNGKFVKEFDYIIQCCEYLNMITNSSATISSVRAQIDKSVRTGKPYKKVFTFKKE